MRPSPRVAGPLAAALVCLAASALLPGRARAGAETVLDKYQVLLQEKRGLARENALLQQESAVAVTKSPYIFFHLERPRLEFRVRGKAFKAYSFGAMSLDERGRRPADMEAIWKAIDKPLTVEEIEGSRPELIPPDPETGREAGLLFSDPNQLAAQTGAAPQPVRTDAGVLGVDVPSEYFIRLAIGPVDDGAELVLNIRTPRTLSFREKAADRLDEIAADIRATWSRWWSGKDLEAARRPRVVLYLTTDTDTAKNLHYSLLPGEKVFVVPPPPPPIVLVATGKAPSGGDRPAPASR